VFKKFPYSPETIRSLEKTLSHSRLSTYRSVVGDNDTKALELYAWNTAVSAALYVPLQGLEVSLRNTMAAQLTVFKGTSWFEQLPFLRSVEQQQIMVAKDELEKRGRPCTDCRLIAELSFGFWVALLGKSYTHSLWTTALRKGFAPKLDNKVLYQKLDHLRRLRNRIAHHEPIFRRDLHADHASILTVVGWICQDTRRWLEHQSGVVALLSQRHC
jgi:hypothetical protein